MRQAVRIVKVLGLLALFMTTASQATATAPASDAQSLVNSFSQFWSAARGKPFAVQEELWNKYIEQPRQDIYESVVWETRDYPDWRKLKAEMLKARFSQYPQISARIPAEIQALETAITPQSVRFRKLFPDAAAHPPVAIVLAPDFDSKSGVLGNGSPVLALSADTLILEKANLDILFPHELFHLYDATHAGVTNDGVMPNANITLPLFAEGLATYVSTVISPGYTDGQYLAQKNLGELPDSRLPETARRFLKDANAPAVNSPQFERWFMSSRDNYQPDLPNRAGYWLGLHLIRQLRRTRSLQEIAGWSPAKAQSEMHAALIRMANKIAP